MLWAGHVLLRSSRGSSFRHGRPSGGAEYPVQLPDLSTSSPRAIPVRCCSLSLRARRHMKRDCCARWAFLRRIRLCFYETVWQRTSTATAAADGAIPLPRRLLAGTPQEKLGTPQCTSCSCHQPLGMAPTCPLEPLALSPRRTRKCPTRGQLW